MDFLVARYSALINSAVSASITEPFLMAMTGYYHIGQTNPFIPDILIQI